MDDPLWTSFIKISVDLWRTLFDVQPFIKRPKVFALSIAVFHNLFLVAEPIICYWAISIGCTSSCKLLLNRPQIYKFATILSVLRGTPGCRGILVENHCFVSIVYDLLSASEIRFKKRKKRVFWGKKCFPSILNINWNVKKLKIFTQEVFFATRSSTNCLT